MKVDRQRIAQLCKQYGGSLSVPQGIDAARLLWALAGNESSFGANVTPRHEDAYCPNRNGRYAAAMKDLTAAWGCLAHCSYGPWQVLLANAPDYSPIELLNDPEPCIIATLRFLRVEIFGRQGAVNLAQVADAYNTGNFRDSIIPEKYIDDLEANYNLPMPLLGTISPDAPVAG